MDSSQKKITCSAAKEFDMVDYLSSIGHEPKKIRGYDYWYLSPLRDERTASFKVNRRINCWFDHGVGKGGNLLDFAILYHNCTIKEFLESLGGKLFSPRPSVAAATFKESSIEICTISSLQSIRLLRYLQDRRIPLSLARLYCREVSFIISGRKSLAIGFANDSGGFELRNQHIKISSSPKSISTFKTGSDRVAVFEGFFDFLSWLVICPERVDFCVLNSLSFFEKARPLLESYRLAHLYLDNDKAGHFCRDYALTLSSGYRDESGLYKHYKDLNEWLCHPGKTVEPP